MRKTLVKTLSFIILIIAIVCSFSFVACGENAPLVIQDSDNCVVISVTEKSIGNSETLLDYMSDLKSQNELDFTFSSGMVTSVNGIKNAVDFSSCWILYTSDNENANAAWGTVEYGGDVYGSAVLGANALKIKSGCVYIWVYKAF